jgi:hypothetical protein
MSADLLVETGKTSATTVNPSEVSLLINELAELAVSSLLIASAFGATTTAEHSSKSCAAATALGVPLTGMCQALISALQVQTLPAQSRRCH